MLHYFRFLPYHKLMYVASFTPLWTPVHVSTYRYAAMTPLTPHPSAKTIKKEEEKKKRKVNKALDTLRDGWNHHGMRTSHQLSPQQLFTQGALKSSLFWKLLIVWTELMTIMVCVLMTRCHPLRLNLL